MAAPAFLVELPVFSAFRIAPPLTQAEPSVAPQAVTVGFGGGWHRSGGINGAIPVDLFAITGVINYVCHCGCLALSITA